MRRRQEAPRDEPGEPRRAPRRARSRRPTARRAAGRRASPAARRGTRSRSQSMIPRNGPGTSASWKRSSASTSRASARGSRAPAPPRTAAGELPQPRVERRAAGAAQRPVDVHPLPVDRVDLAQLGQRRGDRRPPPARERPELGGRDVRRPGRCRGRDSDAASARAGARRPRRGRGSQPPGPRAAPRAAASPRGRGPACLVRVVLLVLVAWRRGSARPEGRPAGALVVRAAAAGPSAAMRSSGGAQRSSPELRVGYDGGASGGPADVQRVVARRCGSASHCVAARRVARPAGADQPLEDAHCGGSGSAGGGVQPGGGGQYGAAARCSGVYSSSPISGAGSGASGSRSAPKPSACSCRSKPSLRTRWSK